MSDEDYELAALYRERDGYSRYGRNERAAEVQVQIDAREKQRGEKPKQVAQPVTGQVTRTGADADPALQQPYPLQEQVAEPGQPLPVVPSQASPPGAEQLAPPVVEAPAPAAPVAKKAAAKRAAAAPAKKAATAKPAAKKTAAKKA